MRTTGEWILALEKGMLDERLQEIYVEGSVALAQRERYAAAVRRYEELFGAGEAGIFSAPGRSEVGGNHTDHQRGEVLAAAVNLDALAVAGIRGDNQICIQSEGYERVVVDLNDLGRRPDEEGTSAALIRGMAAGLKERGFCPGGFQAYITSDVLNGAGLSSSAAFETLIGTVASGLFFGASLDPVMIAQISQQAENVYFGKPCGLMDQMACSVGGLIHIDFQDSAAPVVGKVEADFAAHGYSLCIVDTKGSHADLTAEYAAIPAEMKAVAAFFGKEVLREVPEMEVYAAIPQLREKLGDRPVLRALHFYQENRRVEGQVRALQDGDFARFLGLIQESGDSSFQFLQNVYTNTDVQNQSMSVGLAVSGAVLKEIVGIEGAGTGGSTAARSHGACRVHGGGFAGTIQAFVEDGFVETYRASLDAVFGEGACHVLKVRPLGGIRV